MAARARPADCERSVDTPLPRGIGEIHARKICARQIGAPEICIIQLGIRK
jgi:hypothetical protein